MATFPRLVNKQFNSPIGLYSKQNIDETLSKQSQVLSNGAVGIDFSNPTSTKPANLANSAVLRMLEEEEMRQRNGQTGRYHLSEKDRDPNIRRTDRFIDWPPRRGTDNSQINMNCAYSGKFFVPRTTGTKRIAWPPPPDQTEGEEVEPRVPVQRQEAPVKLHQSPALSRLIPFDNNPTQHAPPQPRVYSPQPPQGLASPSFFNQPSSPQPHSPQPRTPTQIFPPPDPQPFVLTSQTLPRAQPSSFAPVTPKAFAPVVPKAFAPVTSPSFNGYPAANSTPPQTFTPVSFQPSAPLSPKPFGPSSPQVYAPVSAPTFAPPPQLSGPGSASSSSPRGWAPISPTAYFAPAEDQSVEPPPSTITLRPAPPIHQKTAPVVLSQPATQTFQGGINMRGDQKWPPQSVKEAVAAENEARIEIAKGPACRPRKIKKDYGQFFAKNALPHNYSGYRAPPGTQHFADSSGESQF